MRYLHHKTQEAGLTAGGVVWPATTQLGATVRVI